MASFGHLYSANFKAEDFIAEPKSFTITNVVAKILGKEGDTDQKLVLFVKEDERGITLNKTRYGEMVDLFGSDDTDNWIGGTIKCVTTKTKFGGKIVPSFSIQAAD